MSFLGDFFLPKHAFRTMGKMAGAAIPGQDAEGHRPGPRQVMTHFTVTATNASKAIGDRLFSGQPWAARCLPGSTFNLGGLVVLLGWVCIVAVLMCIAWAKLISGIQNQHMPRLNMKAVVAPAKPAPAPAEPAPVKPEGGNDGR